MLAVMAGFKRRLVLKPHVSGSDFEVVAWDQNWNLTEMDQEDAGASVDTWVTDDMKTEIHFVDDRPIGLTYITLYGEAVDLVEEQIRTNTDVWTLPEAVEALGNACSSGDKAASLYTVALTATGPEDEAVVEHVRPLAADPDVFVRQAFIEATGYLPWRSLVALVEELARNDPDQAVRENAQILLDGIDSSRQG